MFLLVLVILASVTSLATSQNPLIRSEDIRIPTTKAEDFRLPRDIKALDYTITLQPIFHHANFNGQCSFRFEALKAVNKIILHSSGLTFDQSQVIIYEESTNIRYGVTLQESGDDREFLTLTLDGTLAVGQTYRADFNSYVGKLYSDNNGFYLGQYTSSISGETRMFATTQFESTGARRVFPCMDEPEYKAFFELRIIRETQLNCTSNMPIFKTEEVDGFKKDIFYKSLFMSTYLLAFTVSDFEYIFDDNMNWIYARPEAIRAGHADYALSVSQKVLDELADFTEVLYVGDKMEQISFPDRYFSAGAMENWGHVTYRDSLLLFDPEVSTTANKQSILNTIAHEFGHQWFGNLVTPKWWEYLWLSEGFATYLSYVGARVGAPSWIVDQFFTSSLHNALDRDSSVTTRPMNQEVGSPAEIDWMFDVISYDKGACIIRMVESFMSTPAFQRGIKSYLNEMAFQAAVPQDLYTQLAKEITLPNSLPPDTTLEQVMSAWTDVAGYPLVSVRKWSSQAFFMQQEHFVTNGDPRTTLWPIPINWAVEGNANFDDVLPIAWIGARESIVVYGEIPENAWYLINKQQTGYFRVNYDSENWNNLIKQLTSNYHDIHALNRAQLLDDSFYLARFGRLDFAITLNMTRYIKDEFHVAPLNVFYKMLTFLNKFMARERNYKDFQAYIGTILYRQYELLGSDPNSQDNQMNVMNRISALTWIGKNGFRGGQFRTKALATVKSWLQGSATIVPDLQAPYFCAAMAIANAADWEVMYNRYQSTKDSAMKSRLLASLGCSESNPIRDEFLFRALQPVNGFSDAEILDSFRSIYRSGDDGASHVYKYIIQNFYQLKEKTNVANLLDGVCALFTTSIDLAMVKNNAESFGEVDGIFKSAIQRVQDNYTFGSKYIVSIADWFANA